MSKRGRRRAAVLSLLFVGWSSIAAAADPAGSDTGTLETSDSAAAAPPTDHVEIIDQGEPATKSDDSSASSAGGDVVETIDQGPETVPLPSSTEAEAEPDRFEVHGWARQSVELGFSRQAFHEAQPNPTALPYYRIVARTQALIRARYSRGRSFEASVSGVLPYFFGEQGPDRRSKTFNGFNGQATRGVLEPSLYELYLGFYWKRFDLRIGQQRVAWGRADFISPNDVVNARDTRDPFVSETELRFVPTPMVRGDIDFGFASLELLVSPVFVPDRFDVYGSNWAGVQPGAPAPIRGFVNLVRRSFDPTLQEHVERVLESTRLPKSNLTAPLFGARLSWSAAGIDVNHYYHFGFDGPLLTVDAGLLSALAMTDFSQAGLADFQPVLAAIDAGQRPFDATYVRRHHVGLDAATTVGPFAIRLDTAYESRRVFFRRDLLGTTSPSLQTVVSLEYQTGDADKLILLEAMYLKIFDPKGELLVWDRNTVGLAALVRWTLWDPFGFEVRTLIGVQPRTLIVQPQLNAKFDPLTFSVGGLWLSGEDYSPGGYFHRNREVYAKAKYAF